jgi:hypothetical protein
MTWVNRDDRSLPCHETHAEMRFKPDTGLLSGALLTQLMELILEEIISSRANSGGKKERKPNVISRSDAGSKSSARAENAGCNAMPMPFMPKRVRRSKLGRSSRLEPGSRRCMDS